MIEHTTGESKRLVQRLQNVYAENLTAGIRVLEEVGQMFWINGCCYPSAPEQASNVP